jgi:predicted transcriptional regulator
MKEEALSEIILRKYEKPVNLNRRELAKKICLSLGLLQPGDSRDVVVDVLLVLKEASKEKKELNSEEIKNQVIKIRQESNLELKGIADSNIRRQLKRMRDLFLVEKNSNLYRINEFSKLGEIFSTKIEKFYIQDIIQRIKENLEEFDRE